jgi:hypothetical protein
VDPEVEALLKQYVFADLWTDRKNRKDEENKVLLNTKYGAALPLYILFTPDGREIARIGGRPSVAAFVEFLKKGLSPTASK